MLKSSVTLKGSNYNVLQDERITRTIARTFAPEFSHTMDFPCPLLWTEADNDALAFAEILETAELTLEVWHQVPGMGSGRKLLPNMYLHLYRFTCVFCIKVFMQTVKPHLSGHLRS